MERSGGLGIGGFLALMFVACAFLLFLGAAPAAPGGPTAAETSAFWRWVEAEVAKADVAANNRALLDSNYHAVVENKRGKAAIDTAASFGLDGFCDLGPSARMTEPSSGRIILCAFLGMSQWQIHVAEKDGETVTDITPDSMRNPQRYISNSVEKRGYTLEKIFDDVGNMPRWFYELFSPLR